MSLSDFMTNAKGMTKNPLSIIGLFISLIYGLACIVLGFSKNSLNVPEERLFLIWFIVLFPCLILGVFTFLVVYHHKKLYGPGDYKDEKNFTITYSAANNSNVTKGLEKVSAQLKSLKPDENSESFAEQVNNISTEIEKIKEISEKIPIDNKWILNHWGSDVASIQDGKMIFKGTKTRLKTDGCHVNLNNSLRVGGYYKVSCFAKSASNTTGKFQLWCHDNLGARPNGSDSSILYSTPSIEGESCSLIFHAKFNSDIRIHLQYEPGNGQIEVSNVKITELENF